MPQDKEDRDYRKEYDSYHASPEQKKRRAARNKARKKLGLAKGDPREAGHVGANRRGRLGKAVRAESFKSNRSKQPKRDGSED